MAAADRRGMTLLETMIAVSVLGVVMTAVMSSFVAAQRMLKDAMGLSELSLAAREIREKILFHASPGAGGTSYAGLLSCRLDGDTGLPFASSGGAVTMEGTSLGSSLSATGSTAKVRIELHESAGGRRYLCNVAAGGSPTSRWMSPPGTGIAASSLADLVSFDTPAAVGSCSYGSAQNAVRLNIDLVIASDARNPDGSPMVRRERIVAPVFGAVQPFKVTSGGKDHY